MKTLKKRNQTNAALFAGATALVALTPHIHAQTSDDALINKLEQKGILSVDEAKQLRAESAAEQTNLVNSALMATKWKISNSIKNIELFGDVRFRYEYRAADNPTPNNSGVGGPPSSGVTGSTYAKERFRYALRVGVRGDLYDDFNYGIRLETSSNPRSTWVTFGGDTGSSSAQTATTPTSGTPSDKSQDSIYVGQIYLGWHPEDWFQMTVGRMPMPLYTTSMVWDGDINPEGAFEKFKFTLGNVDLFADFGQFDYQNPTATTEYPSGDTFLLAWQLGANIKCGPDMFFKIAPVLYTYTGTGNPTPAGTTPNIYSPYFPYVGQGDQYGLNGTWNQAGINNLLVLEIPEEFDFQIHNTPLGPLQARVFGDVAYNFQGNDRARAAYAAGNGAAGAFPGMSSAATGQNEAYQIGFGVGSPGPIYGPTQGYVYGSASKKNNWEFRFYYQKVEQYALDVNLMDSDFFEGRANLQGYFSAFAYNFTDAIIGTVRYGYATRIDNQLGTGGNNLDMPNLNPINNYNLFQLDLTWRL